MGKVAVQAEFRPILPVVVGNKDYRETRAMVERIDELLARSGLEDGAIRAKLATERFERAGDEARAWKQAQLALRCTLARQLTVKAVRSFSAQLADSPLWQWFCRIDRLLVVRVPSKSALQRYEAMWSEAEIRALIGALNEMATSVEGAQRLGLNGTLDVSAYFADTTCVKADIHFPTDWVLLRDAARTLIKAVSLIRQHGIRHRMPAPEGFLRAMNALCMAMTQGRRRPDSRRQRKRVLRQMKRLTQTIRRHAQRHRDALLARREESDLSEAQARQIVGRLDNVLEQLPAAIKQAHERIIGARQVPNAEKILSLYDPDIHVIVRGKADAEVEFGNVLYLAEQLEGVIVDWSLLREGSPGDARLLEERLAVARDVLGADAIRAVGADRGFDTRKVRDLLAERKIYNGICPRDPRRLKRRLAQEDFRALQWRRGQTEGRIGILKNAFLGSPLRNKGFASRERSVAWAVLAHNLWVFADLPQAKTLEKAA